jgi:hypothetical protein
MSDSAPCDTESAATVSRFAPSADAIWRHLRTIKASYNPLAVRHAREMLEWSSIHHPDAAVRFTAAGFLKHLGKPA